MSSDDGGDAVVLSAAAVRVTIRGHLARTEYELTFRNRLTRIVGGDFVFPLPPDAEVSDLGLYFGGKLRHAVAVERVQAKRGYEETVHRRVDPALAEWSDSRAFRMRGERGDARARHRHDARALQRPPARPHAAAVARKGEDGGDDGQRGMTSQFEAVRADWKMSGTRFHCH